MKLPILALLACVLTFAGTQGNAQTVSEKGMGRITYSGELTATDRQQAMRKAEINALERYVANTNSARARTFEQKRSQFETKADNYILGSVLLSEDDNPPAGSYSVVIRADINVTRLLNDLGSQSASMNDGAVKQRPAMITFLFMARSQSSVQSFDAKVYKREDTGGASKKETREGESVRTHSVETSDQIRDHSSSTISRGGSTTRKADKVQWTVTQASEINSAMTGKFADSGYDVIEANQVEDASGGLLNIAAIRRAYSEGSDLPSQMIRETTKGVHEAGLALLALGTLDVGMQDIDPISGNTRVYVTVTGKVYDVRGRFARTITSVGPVQYAGLGPNATVARTNALKTAAQNAAQTMVDELKNKNVY